jgi:hemolysin activation/secretion protein
MRRAILKGLFKLIVFFIPLFITRPLYSQGGIERATREVDRLGGEKVEEKLERAPQKPAEIKKEEEAPVKKGEKTFFIKKINLVGCESFSPQVFSSLIKEYENKEVTLTDLDILAKDIEQAYLERGVIAAVFVPPQEIKDQTVTLQVVEARMGELQIQDHKFFSKKRLSYYWRIPPGKILRYDKISRSIKIMNKNPDREVKSTLVAGKKPGTTDVVLTPTTSFPVHFISSFDKEGITATGKSRITFGMRDNNFLGWDDMLLTGYTFGKDFTGQYVYHSLPITPNGASLIYGYSTSKATPGKDFASLGIISTAKNASVSIHQDLYKKDNYLGEVYLGFDAKDKTIAIRSGATGTYNRDRLRIFSLGANLSHRDLSSVTSFSPEFDQGVTAFGASTRHNPLASRLASSRFSKFKLTVQHKRRLPFDLEASLKLKGQAAFSRLTPQEEFSLGGIDSVRGYPPDDYLADNAVLTSAELLIPSFFIPQKWRLPYAEAPIREQITGVLFTDYGWGARRGTLANEKKSRNLLSMGAGFRIRLFNQALLRLEWGFPIGDNRALTESGDSRFHFAVDFQDQLPQEMQRIEKLREEARIRQTARHLVNKELAKKESPVRQKLQEYLSLADSYQKEGKLQEAKELYERIIQISKSLYQQAQDYVTDCLKLKKDLREYRRLAILNYKAGRFQQAKQLWQKIVDEAESKSLTFKL